jgi:uncharacterized protein YjbI with pentapeptide repeats
MDTQELNGRHKAGERGFGGVNLEGVKLIGTNLSGTDLSETDLRWASLRAVDLSGARLSRADLWCANWGLQEAAQTTGEYARYQTPLTTHLPLEALCAPIPSGTSGR